MGKRTRGLLNRSLVVTALAAPALFGFYACRSAPLHDSDSIGSGASAVSEGDGATEPAMKMETTPVQYVDVKASAADPLAFEISISSQKAKDGSLVQLRLKPIAAIDVESVTVRLEDQDYPVISEESGKGLVALVAVPFNSQPRETKIILSWHEKNAKQKHTTSLPLSVIDGKYRSEVLKVQKDKISPPKKSLKRIAAEQKEIGAIYQLISKERYWSGPFALPIDSEITSPFGNKRTYNGMMKSFHQGLDLRARTPLPIRAPEGAKVVLAKDLYFTGFTVILDHGYGLFTIYGHMSKLDVKKGELVKKGQVLGLSGATGRASGPHLHWGAVLMRLKFNPQDLVQVLR